ncbi:hypothetical protein [Achromobacter animicus]|uniref:hypothetical protein n=1 Tax=Achromobacter animicus TaxID=1389935 RepID=UPI0028ADE4FC|nr:hypothetical protein [Achromobacter animicus]
MYVYVDGCDLHEVEDALVDRIVDFLHKWGVTSARLVNDKFPPSPELGGSDLPEWNLGLNFETPFLSAVQFEMLISFLRALAAETDRDFAIGGSISASQCPEDFAFIDSDTDKSTVELLRTILTEP